MMSSLQISHFSAHIGALRAVSAAAAVVALAAPMAASAVPLTFYSYASVYGYINTQIHSQLLGDVSFTLSGPQDYKYNSTGLTTGVANASYNVPTGPASGGTDPVYDIVTSGGQYGFSYTGQAETAGTRLKTQIGSATVDSSAQLVDSPVSYLNAYSQAQWSQQMVINPGAGRAIGDYGAIPLSFRLEGSFPALSDLSHQNDGQAWGQIGTSFTDISGVSYQSNFSVSASASDPSWNGHTTTGVKKFLFQYGRPFTITLNQWAYAGPNGNADFFNTGYIDFMELPFGATLDSGAQQAGLGSLAQLYGNVIYSTTVDDPNTNWDFGNGGGVFQPPVPEPETWALLLGGLGMVGFVARRRLRAGACPEFNG